MKSSETSDVLNAHRGNGGFEFEAQIPTQEEGDEKNKTYITTLTKQPEDLTRLIQGMSSVHQTNVSPRASTSANSSAVGISSDS